MGKKESEGQERDGSSDGIREHRAKLFYALHVDDDPKIGSEENQRQIHQEGRYGWRWSADENGGRRGKNWAKEAGDRQLQEGSQSCPQRGGQKGRECGYQTVWTCCNHRRYFAGHRANATSDKWNRKDHRQDTRYLQEGHDRHISVLDLLGEEDHLRKASWDVAKHAAGQADARLPMSDVAEGQAEDHRQHGYPEHRR